MPPAASAQVVLSEIMYNPQGTDTGREWVELYNAGSGDVTIIGGSGTGSWRIQDSSKHTLTDPSGGTGRGSLVIPAHSYLIISSDPTTFITGEYAGGAYSVVKSSISLTNTGNTISLLDGSGATVDSVAYSSTQGASDDGTSLQRQASGAWITALPTPGTDNATTAYVPPVSDSGSASSTSSQASTQVVTGNAGPVDSYVPPPVPSLFADAGDDRTVIVGADVEFDGSAYDKNQNTLDSSTTRFSWNFGDGTTADGSSVIHHFDYPGKYAVVLTIAKITSSVDDTIIVTAEPAALSFSVLPDGGLAIKNLAGHELDLSRWIIRAGSSPFAPQFVLPPHSKLLAGGTLQIGSEVLQFKATADAMLQYPNGTLALAAGQSSAPSPVAAATAFAPPAVAAPTAPPAVQAAPLAPSEKDTEPTPDTAPEIQSVPTNAAKGSTSSQAAAAGSVGLSFAFGKLWWWLGAFVLAALGGVALVFSRTASKKEWDIGELGE